MNVHLLQLAIYHDKCLTNAFSVLKQAKIAANDTRPITYNEFFRYIQDSCLLHDMSSPLVSPLQQAHAASSSPSPDSGDNLPDYDEQLATISAFLSSTCGCDADEIHEFEAFAACCLRDGCSTPHWRLCQQPDPAAQIPEPFWS